MVLTAPVWQDHLVHGAAVPVGVPHNDLHLSAERQPGGELFRPCAERLMGFRTVDSPQPDVRGPTGVHHFDGVAVRDGDNLAGLAGSARIRNCGAGAMACGQNCRNGTEDHQNGCQKETVTKVWRHRGISEHFCCQTRRRPRRLQEYHELGNAVYVRFRVCRRLWELDGHASPNPVSGGLVVSNPLLQRNLAATTMTGRPRCWTASAKPMADYGLAGATMPRAMPTSLAECRTGKHRIIERRCAFFAALESRSVFRRKQPSRFSERRHGPILPELHSPFAQPR